MTDTLLHQSSSPSVVVPSSSSSSRFSPSPSLASSSSAASFQETKSLYHVTPTFPTILSSINDATLATVPSSNDSNSALSVPNTTVHASGSSITIEPSASLTIDPVSSSMPLSNGIHPLSMEDVLQIIHETSQHNLLISAKSATGKPLKGAAKSKAQAKAIASLLSAVENHTFTTALLAGEGSAVSNPSSSSPSSPHATHSSSLSSPMLGETSSTLNGTTVPPLLSTLPIEPTTSSILGFAPGITLTKLAYQTFCLALTQNISTALQSLQTGIQQTLQAKYPEDTIWDDDRHGIGFLHPHPPSGTAINPYDSSVHALTHSPKIPHLQPFNNNRKRKASMDLAHYTHYNPTDTHDTLTRGNVDTPHVSPLIRGTNGTITGSSLSPLPSSFGNIPSSTNQAASLSSSSISPNNNYYSPYHNYQYRSLPFPSSWLSSTLLKQQRRQHSNSVTSHGSTSNDEPPTYGTIIDGTPSSVTRMNHRQSFDSIVTPTNKGRITSIQVECTPRYTDDDRSKTNSCFMNTNDVSASYSFATAQSLALPSPHRPLPNEKSFCTTGDIPSPRKYSLTSDKYRYTDSQYYRQLLELLSTQEEKDNHDDVLRMTTVDPYGYYRSTRSVRSSACVPTEEGSVLLLSSSNNASANGTKNNRGIPIDPLSVATVSSSVSLPSSTTDPGTTEGTDSRTTTDITVHLYPSSLNHVSSSSTKSIRLPLTFGFNHRPVPRYSLSAVDDKNITNPVDYTAYRLKYGYFILDGYPDSMGNTTKKIKNYDHQHIQQWCIMRDTERTDKDGYDLYIWAEYRTTSMNTSSSGPSSSSSYASSSSTSTGPPTITPLVTNLDWSDIRWYSDGVIIRNELSYRLIGIQYQLLTVSSTLSLEG